MHRINYPSGAKWEDIVGYSRAVRIGNTVEVTGTVAVDSEGKTVGLNNPYEQTRFVYRKIEKVLAEAGASLSDVVRCRMFVTDIKQWEAYGRGHAEFFREIKPCLSMIEISALIDPEYMVEIEVSAIIS